MEEGWEGFPEEVAFELGTEGGIGVLEYKTGKRKSSNSIPGTPVRGHGGPGRSEEVKVLQRRLPDAPEEPLVCALLSLALGQPVLPFPVSWSQARGLGIQLLAGGP